MINTVIFDNGEVLFRGFYGMGERISAVFHREIIHDELWKVPELQQFFRGQVSEEAMWLGVIRRFGLDDNVRLLKDLVRGNFSPIDGTLEVVRDLRERRFRLAILSVHGRKWIAHLESRYNFHRFFSCMAYSYKTGLMKPEQEAFHDLLKRLGQPDPETCLFVDDSKDNVLAAEKLGFQVHLFVDAVVLRHELEQLGLLRPKKQPPFVLRQHSPP